jgi:hypothetical protein
MMYMRGSLGVQCEHCHNEKDWSSDEKDPKRTARKMIQMVRDINRTLGDDLAVSCYSCHRGKLRPATSLPLLTERPAAPSTAVNPTPASKAIRADDVVKQYLEASGGPAWSRLTTRVVKGRLVTSEPAIYPAEISYKAPDAFRSRILVDGAPFTKIFDGTRGWSADNRGSYDAHGPELERLKRQAVFSLPIALPTLYPSLAVEGESAIGGARVLVLKAAPRSPGARGRSPLLQRRIRPARADRVDVGKPARRPAPPMGLRGLPEGGRRPNAVQGARNGSGLHVLVGVLERAPQRTRGRRGVQALDGCMRSRQMKTSVFIGTRPRRLHRTSQWRPSTSCRPVVASPTATIEFMATVDALVIGRKDLRHGLVFDKWPYGEKTVVVLSTRPLAPRPAWGCRWAHVGDSRRDFVAAYSSRHRGTFTWMAGSRFSGFFRTGSSSALVITRVSGAHRVPGFRSLDPYRRDIVLSSVGTRQYASGLVKVSMRLSSSSASTGCR